MERKTDAQRICEALDKLIEQRREHERVLREGLTCLGCGAKTNERGELPCGH